MIEFLLDTNIVSEAVKPQPKQGGPQLRFSSHNRQPEKLEEVSKLKSLKLPVF